LVSGKNVLPSSYTAFFLSYHHMAGGVREMPKVYFIKVLIPFMRTVLHDLTTYQKPHLLIPYMGLGFLHVNFGKTYSLEHKHTHIFHIL
jgi:hypothetical protein